jgi:hypothetical protein
MALDITTLFAGAGAGVLGAAVGAWMTVRLGYAFQKNLQLEQQDFQKRILEEQLAFQSKLLSQQLEYEGKLSAQTEIEIQKRHTQMAEIITYLRDTLNTRFSQTGGHLSSIAARLDEIAKKK